MIRFPLLPQSMSCRLPLLAVTLLIVSGRPAAAQDKRNDSRVRFVHDIPGESRYHIYRGRGVWEEFREGKLYRRFREAARNDSFIEIETQDPVPGITRIYTNGNLQWRLSNDPPTTVRGSHKGTWRRS